MELSKIIKTQQDFEDYLKFNDYYRNRLLKFYLSYIEIFKFYGERKKELSVPQPSRGEVMEILQLKEDIYFMGYKLNFN